MELVRPWWHNTEELAEFAEWMVDMGHESSWKTVVAKPWHYESEHRTYDRELEMERIAAEAEALEDEAWRDMERRASL